MRKKLLFLFVLVQIISLLISYSSPFTPPSIWIVPQLFGLIFPIIFISGTVLFIFLLVFHKKGSLVLLIALLPSIFFINRFIQISIHTTTNQSSYRLISHNVKNFNLYQWLCYYESRNEYFDFYKSRTPQFLLTQEHYHNECRFNTLDSMAKAIGLPYYCSRMPHILYEEDQWGLVTFSSTPAISKNWLEINALRSNGCSYQDYILNTDTLRLINIHLSSMNLMTHVREDEHYYKDKWKSFSLIDYLSIFKQACIQRENQVDRIIDLITHTPFKIILCGDLNDNSMSYCYQQLTGYLNDAYISKGNGFSTTYTDIPGLRLDYIFYSDNIKAIQYKSYNRTTSDHKALEFDFSLQNR